MSRPMRQGSPLLTPRVRVVVDRGEEHSTLADALTVAALFVMFFGLWVVFA